MSNNKNTTLNYGAVLEYISKRGFGFIRPLSFIKASDHKVFFHISKVKLIGIEARLKEFKQKNTEEIKFWFITEETSKGKSVSECWLNSNDIPKKYLVQFIDDISDFLPFPIAEIDYNPPVDETILPDQTSNKDQEILEYVKIFRDEGFTEHWHVNRYITHHNLWDFFTNIRAYNNHGIGKENILGILPEHYATVCHILEIDGDRGDKLIESIKY